MNLKRKFILFFACGIIFFSQTAIINASSKVEFTLNTIISDTITPLSVLHNIPITTHSDPKPTPE